MSLGTTRDTTARIRILSCEPEPVAPPTRSWPLWTLVGATAVAGVGIIAVTLRAPADEVPAATTLVSAVPVQAMGTANAGSFRVTPRVARQVAVAVSADFTAAARYAARNMPVVVPAAPAQTPSVISGWQPSTQPVAPAPVAPDSSSGTSSGNQSGPSVTIREDTTPTGNQAWSNNPSLP